MNIAKMESMNSMDAKVISENELLMAFAILGPLVEKLRAHRDDCLLENRAVKIAIQKGLAAKEQVMRIKDVEMLQIFSIF